MVVVERIDTWIINRETLDYGQCITGCFEFGEASGESGSGGNSTVGNRNTALVLFGPIVSPIDRLMEFRLRPSPIPAVEAKISFRG